MDISEVPACDTANEYDGRLGIRVSSIFVILVGSTLGALLPVIFGGQTQSCALRRIFFFAKYFGSGVIIATAFIHLLAPAEDALRNPCLTGPITEYAWVEGICLMMIFLLFFVEIMIVRYGSFESDHYTPGHVHGQHLNNESSTRTNRLDATATGRPSGNIAESPSDKTKNESNSEGDEHYPGENCEYKPNAIEAKRDVTDTYTAQVTAILVLEFGVIFHSIFIGLTLAVAGSEFATLYIVLVFHQTFEGLALGTRLATVPWPKSKRWTPYLFALAYGLTTPIAIAIGLGFRASYLPGGATTLLVNGIFDSISAGILIYTGLIELMAHEFLFSPTMRKAPIRIVASAFYYMCLGAGLMALLGKWA